MASRYYLLSERISKPFNPLLGETYEVVTPRYRAVSEQVSHHPPVEAMQCQGEGFVVQKVYS
jgi:hypothetical protein